ncbi:MAG: hypothetical protein M0R80_31590 [Proteobacteria bacterium]|nr:hypothetical protein [Pseudomonadota bacterium]
MPTKKTTEKKPKKDYVVTKKRSGRYAVVGKDGKQINGEAKVEILLKEGVIKKQVKKAKPAEDKPAEA